MMVVLSEVIQGSSFPPTNHKYDVFISFRGIDTRLGFTNHLHKTLVDANISVFLDDEEIETGEDLKPELESAIKESRASIIVFSENYANSSWCLDELVLILKQRMASNQVVIPIFYRVEPTHIRKQESTFGFAMTKHKEKMEAEIDEIKRNQMAQKIDKWTKALTEVANLKGENTNGRQETEIIEGIVEDLYRRLHVPLRSALPPLIGMEYSIKFVTSWLENASSNTGDILTIFGMSGIGKTCLTKYVYGLHFSKFDRSCYIEDISRRSASKHNGLLDLQKQLCKGISKRSSTLYDESGYTSNIENVVTRKKVFLILDDIDSLHQLESLLGNEGFHPGSKIIITTQDASLTKSCMLFKTNFKPKHEKHQLRGLRPTEARQLLCNHAFMSNGPKAGYEEVTEKIVMYCEGNPLALKVLGRSLHNKDVPYWEGQINLLKNKNGSPVTSLLKTSLDSLPSEDDKDSFKDIACFFVGMDRDVTETILQSCSINTSISFRNLNDRCLLSIGWNNELVMHRLLQEMGRFIVRQESVDKPWKRSRLCCHDESLEVLKRKSGTKNIRGLMLDTRMLKNEKLRETFELETDALRKMDNLMLLQLNFVQIKGSYEQFPKELRWLCMHGFPLKSIPSDLPMENLVVLDMSYSNIESFGICYSNPEQPQMRQKKLPQSCSKDKKLLGSLKILNLSFCEKLHSLGGFEGLPALERLIVRNCIGLVEVCESIEQCAELLLIDLRNCNNLEKTPRMGKLQNLKTLLLDGCNLGSSRIKIRNMDSPEMLTTNNIVLDIKTSSSIPSDSKFFTISLPSSLIRLSLANNNLSNDSFPMDFTCLSMLKELCLDDNPIVSLPNCVRSLPRIEKLAMRYCNMLCSVKHPPRSLTHLDLRIFDDYNKRSLVYVSFDPEMSPLRLSLAWGSSTPPSFQIEGILKIEPIADVEEKVLCNLGWTNLDFLKQRSVKIGYIFPELQEYVIQMYYEFGIFSTFYGGEQMPNWIRHRRAGASISFTIPSTSYKLRGLNFCYVQSPSYEFQDPYFGVVDLPMIKISNITRDRTWMYHHFIDKVSVGGDCVILLSHWMFGMDEMEGGDKVTVTLKAQSNQVTEECGVSFVYDDEEEKEDVLGYYKSWNHIIGGDLTGFQLKTGEYSLDTSRFWYYKYDEDPYDSNDVHTKYKEQVWFRALSPRKSNILEKALEVEDYSVAKEWKKNVADFLAEEERRATLLNIEDGESSPGNTNKNGNDIPTIEIEKGNDTRVILPKAVTKDEKNTWEWSYTLHGWKEMEDIPTIEIEKGMLDFSKKMIFSKAVSGSSSSKTSKARYIKPKIDREGGGGVAMIPIDVVQRGSHIFSHTLYGYCIGARLEYSIVNNHIRDMWNAYGIEDVLMNDQGVYFFKFNNEKGLIDVMENGPWTIENVPVFLQRWEAGLDLSKPTDQKVPLWIKIFDIPIELWTEEGLNTIASNLGIPLAFDSLTATRCELAKGGAGYAYVLIEMAATEEWPDEIRILVPKLNGSGSTLCRLRVEYTL